MNQDIQIPYTLGSDTVEAPYHTDVIRTQVTRNLGNKFAEVRDELVTAFTENIPCTGDGTRSEPSR